MSSAGAVESPTSGVASGAVREAFDQVAPSYDGDWTQSAIGRLQRAAVWRTIDGLFQPGDRVLDLGCGTGVDAMHVAAQGEASQGIRVHGIDVAPGMVEVAKRRASDAGLAERVTFQVLGIEDLHLLDAGPFDGVVSNFSPLNCVRDLGPVAAQLGRMVKPGGTMALCVMSSFCLWETLWYPLTAQLYKTSRRWRADNPTASVGLEDEFPIYYPTVKELRAVFGPWFRVVRLEGVGVFVPPSYLEPWARRVPRLVWALGVIDRLVHRWPGLRAMGDHRLLIFERRA